MKMKNYIEAAEKKAGAQAKLSEMLGITARYIRMVKNEERCFSNDVCIQIADYIGADRLKVIAANNLVTEKDERKRRIFESCFQKVASVAAMAFVISILTLAPQQTVKAEIFNNQYTIMQIIGN